MPYATYNAARAPQNVLVGGWDGEMYYLPELNIWVTPETLSDPKTPRVNPAPRLMAA